MSTESNDIEVSFAEVAAESADESIAHEGEAVDALEEAGPPVEDGAVESDDTAPEQPTLSSMIAPGPVSEGDDSVI